MLPRYYCLCCPLFWLTECKKGGRTGDLVNPIVKTLQNILTVFILPDFSGSWYYFTTTITTDNFLC